MRFYVINLAQDTQRLTQLTNQLCRTDLTGHEALLFSAVDGEKEWTRAASCVTTAALKKLHIIQRRGYSDTFGELVSKGAVGCALSHMGVWQHILSSKSLREDEPVLVFEDDAKLLTSKPFRVVQWALDHVPQGWDVLLLGYKMPVAGAVTTHVNHLDTRLFFGMHAYLTTKRAARKLLKRGLPLRMQVDIFLSHLAQAGEAVVRALPRSIVVQQGWKWGSRIQLDRATQLRHKEPNHDAIALPQTLSSASQLRRLTALVHDRVSVLPLVPRRPSTGSNATTSYTRSQSRT